MAVVGTKFKQTKCQLKGLGLGSEYDGQKAKFISFILPDCALGSFEKLSFKKTKQLTQFKRIVLLYMRTIITYNCADDFQAKGI